MNCEVCCSRAHCRTPEPIYSQASKSTKSDVVSALIPTFSLLLRQNTAFFEMRRRVWTFSADFRSFSIIFLDKVFSQLNFSVGLIEGGRGGNSGVSFNAFLIVCLQI